MSKESIYKYAFSLLKRKNYYIKELYNKLIHKYDVKDVNEVIRYLIANNYINDKLLVKLKLDYFINYKLYGKLYIYKYFENHNISFNLIKYLLNSYDVNTFNNNMNKIIDRLKREDKSELYIKKYLLKKGYEISE
jgi:SOS response regulatory protein OraA/RecX